MKNAIVKSTFKLIIYGFIAKVLSMVARIITNRIIKEEGMGIYSLIIPFMIFLITISQLGLPTAIAKLVASDLKNRKKYFVSAFIFGLLINITIMILLFYSAPFIASQVIKNEKTLLTLYGLALFCPLVFISGILKGYCVGLKKVEITALSQISEEVFRIIFIVAAGSFFISKGSEYGALLAMIGVCVGEIFQSLYLVFANHKHIKANLKPFVMIGVNIKEYPLNDILSISLPLTFSRIIASIAYFVEPIILTNILLAQEFTPDQIALNYGQLSAYAMPLLFLPGFFANAFATVLLPNMAQAIANKNLKRARKFFFYLTLASLIIGTTFSFIFFTFPNQLLEIFYGTDSSAQYVRFLAFPFILFYIEAPINNALYALSLDKKAFINSIASSIVRVGCLLLFIPSMGVLGVGLSTIISVVVIVTFGLVDVLRALFRNNK